MRYYFAPMEGFTDAVYRNTHARYFGNETEGTAMDRYYAPFLSPKTDLSVDPRQLRDVLPENNVGMPVIPQILGKDADAFLWMTQKLADMGYQEVNLNLGCPSGTVTAKGKGAGFLQDPEALEKYLDKIFAHSVLPISIKTRIGMRDAEEFGELLELYNQFPVKELTIHPRVGKAFYTGEVNMEVFDWAAAHSKAPVCYNGSLYTVEQVQKFISKHPNVDAIMLGRGLLADPALVRKLHGGKPLEKQELRAFLDEIYEQYVEKFGSRQSTMRRMKGVWGYVLCMFADHEKLEKQLRKLRDPAEYGAVVDAIFQKLELRQDAEDVK